MDLFSRFLALSLGIVVLVAISPAIHPPIFTTAKAERAEVSQEGVLFARLIVTMHGGQSHDHHGIQQPQSSVGANSMGHRGLDDACPTPNVGCPCDRCQHFVTAHFVGVPSTLMVLCAPANEESPSPRRFQAHNDLLDPPLLPPPRSA